MINHSLWLIEIGGVFERCNAFAVGRMIIKPTYIIVANINIFYIKKFLRNSKFRTKTSPTTE